MNEVETYFLYSSFPAASVLSGRKLIKKCEYQYAGPELCGDFQWNTRWSAVKRGRAQRPVERRS